MVDTNFQVKNGLTVNSSFTANSTQVALAGSFIANTTGIYSNNSLFSANTLSVTGAATFSNTLSVTGNSTFSNTLSVTGNSTFSSAATFSNTLSVTGNSTFSNTLSITGAAAFSNTLSVTGNSTFTGAAAFSNTLSVTNAATFSNTLSVTGAATFSNTLSVTGTSTFGNGADSTAINSIFSYALSGDIATARWGLATGSYSLNFFSDNADTYTTGITSNITFRGNTYRPKISFNQSGTLTAQNGAFSNNITIGGTVLSSLYPLLSSSPTFTGGNLTLTASGQAAFQLNGGTSQYKQLNFSTSSSSIWLVGADNSAESGSNAGSNFFFNSYTDAGTFLTTVLSITRSTGIVNLQTTPTIGGTSLSALYPLLSSSPTFTGGIITVQPSSGQAQLILNKSASGQTNILYGKTNNSIRWTFELGNNNSETGSNVGSDFVVNRYNDSGSLIDSPFTITRSTGKTTFSGTTSISGTGQNPSSGAASFSVVASGSYGGGYGLIDGTNNWGIWDNTGTLNFGWGSSGGALTSLLSLNSNGTGLSLIGLSAGGTEALTVQNNSTTTGTQAKLNLNTGLASAYLYAYVNQDSASAASAHIVTGSGITGGVQFDSPVKFNSTVTGITGTVTSDNGVGNVGSFAMLTVNVLSTFASGSTASGSSLQFSYLTGSGGGTVVIATGGSPTGTWRNVTGLGLAATYTGLWQRIA